MSEVQARPFPPRGRGSSRGGRSGFSSGGRGSRAYGVNGNRSETAPAKIEVEEEEDEVGQLKKLYSSQVAMIKEMFPDWSDENVIFALRETEGDLELTVERITDGNISQWGEVSKAKKDKSKSKLKETSVTSSGESSNRIRASRGGRAGFESGRGARGNGTDRGRGGRSRGASSINTPNTRKTNSGNSIPTDEWASWKKTNSGDKPSPHNKNTDDKLTTSKPVDDIREKSGSRVAFTTAKVPATILPDGVQRSWATLFAPAPVPKKSTAPHPERPIEPSKIEEPDKPLSTESLEHIPKAAKAETDIVKHVKSDSTEKAEAAVITSQCDIPTENNIEKLPDTSVPIPTTTVASTATNSWDTRGGANNSSPYITSQNNNQQGTRSATNYQTPVIKGSSTSGRTPSLQRRVFDQEEAVRMPGNREVDRAAVQFGAFFLKDNKKEDVDGDREEAETRAQPPQHSPVTPRASLPPVNQKTTPIADSLSASKPNSSLPATSLPSSVPTLPSPVPPNSAPVVIQQGPQTNGQFSQYGRFAPGTTPDKPYDNFSQQAPSVQSPFEGFPPQQAQTMANATHSGAFSSTPNDYSYYATDPQQRNIYNSFYQPPYGSQHQGAQATQGQDGPVSNQRSFNGYNGPPAENSSQFPQNATHQPQSRFMSASESQNSGHTTPNPVSQAPHPGATTQSGQPQASQQHQVPGTYQYGHPYYSNPYYSAYMNHYPGYGNGNFPAGPYAAKTGIHQHFQGYNISHGPPFEHAASHGTAAFGVSSVHGRDSALGVLSDYGRNASAQSAQTPQNIGGSTTFGLTHDAFGRGSSYQGQGQPQYSNQQAAQQNGDDMKSFSESKLGNGPNSSLQGARPASATNTASGASALPPPQSQQAGYGSYPTHLQQQGHNLHGTHSTSQYGALGGAGLQHQASGQGHQGNQYGGYQGSGGGNYYNNNQQQRGGWGGNYGH